MQLSSPEHQLVKDADHPFFNYTSGRWLYNEQRRLDERHLVFNVPALVREIAQLTKKPVSAVSSLAKIAEGGSFRVFEATLDSGDPVIVRLPYPCTLPRHFGVASEVATLEYLFMKGIPVPRVLGWSASALNPVGTEYIIMSKVDGAVLESIWHTMSPQERMAMVERVVNVESKLFRLEFPACGSIYHRSFMDEHPQLTSVAIDDTFAIGPSAEFLWWYNGRDQLEVDRGPWKSSQAVMQSVAKRELSWLKRFGSPRFPRQPLYREFYNKQEVDPKEQERNLKDYLQLASLIVPDNPSLCKPSLRHPDLSPDNIFISSNGEITGFIDWQHSAVLPLFIQAKVPKHFQNYGDDDSENLRPPKLAESFNTMTPAEQALEEERYRKRQLHYFYVGHTSHNNEVHFAAISKYNLVIRNKLYEAGGRPWEGDNTSLKAEIVNSSKWWPEIASSQAKKRPFPVQISEEEAITCLEIDKKQAEADAQLQILRDFFPVNLEGWTPLDMYEEAKSKEQHIKEQMLEAAETDEERREIEDNWPFRDHEEVD